MHEIEEQGLVNDEEKPKKEENKRVRKMRQKQIDALEDEKFTREYTKAGGI